MENFKIKKETVKGIKINYAETGKGKSLILIHGWTNNWEGWIPLARRLRKHYRLYILDLPGYGDSDPLLSYSIEEEADYVAQFMKIKKIKAEAVIGLSMGSLVTAELGKKHHELAKKIILLGPVFRLNERSIKNILLDSIFPLIKKSKRAESILKRLVETKRWGYFTGKFVNMYKFDSFLVDSYGFIGRIKMRKEAFVEMGISISKFRLDEVLDKYKLPVFLLYGKHDKFCSIGNAKKAIKNKKGDYTFDYVKEAGHIVSIEKPKPVAEKVLNFLENKKH
jgi:pimeloyl-ACP methyl ester carboxylesterase